MKNTQHVMIWVLTLCYFSVSGAYGKTCQPMDVQTVCQANFLHVSKEVLTGRAPKSEWCSGVDEFISCASSAVEDCQFDRTDLNRRLAELRSQKANAHCNQPGEGLVETGGCGEEGMKDCTLTMIESMQSSKGDVGVAYMRRLCSIVNSYIACIKPASADCDPKTKAQIQQEVAKVKKPLQGTNCVINQSIEKRSANMNHFEVIKNVNKFLLENF